MNIGLDLDSTLIKLPCIELASKELGFDFDETHVEDWQFKKVFPEILRHRVFEMFADPKVMCDKVTPIDGTQNKIKEWCNKGHRLTIITSRIDSLQYKTVEMINKFYPEIEKVTFVGFNQSKKEALIENKIQLFVDDGPHNIEVAMEIPNLVCILLSNKYTRYNWYLRDKVNLVKAIKDIQLKDYIL